MTPPKQQQQPKVPPKLVNAYPRKICVVNREVCNLYSLKHLIVPGFVYIFYPVDLLNCLGHQYYTKLDWIQSTHHHIYVSLNESKRDPTHPVWSIVNKRSKCKRLCWSILQYYAWQDFLSKAFLPVKWLLPNKLQGFDFMKCFLLFIVMIKIDNRYSNNWNELVFEDWFGNGWHKWEPSIAATVVGWIYDFYSF